MKEHIKRIYGISASVAMLIIILNGKSAVSSIQSGIDLCLQTVIPALFPFFVLSGIINNCFIGQRFSFMTPLRRFCRIPAGVESVMLIGLISGYPVGAQLITEAHSTGTLSKADATRMLGFCSNAGPAFLFGMLTSVFSRPIILWILWGIHIISAIITGWLLPGNETEDCLLHKKTEITITEALRNAIKNLATVCGWVVLFRLVLAFFNSCFLRLLPAELQVLFSGFVELSNGCMQLRQVQCEGARFIFASAMLAFGGICVAMQTVSVTGKLGTGYYFPGKLLQTCISVLISCILQPFLFQHSDLFYVSNLFLIILGIATVLSIYLIRRKKVVAFSRRMLYNTNN